MCCWETHIVISNIYSYVNPYVRIFEVLSVTLMFIGVAHAWIHSGFSGGLPFGRPCDGVTLSWNEVAQQHIFVTWVTSQSVKGGWQVFVSPLCDRQPKTLCLWNVCFQECLCITTCYHGAFYYRFHNTPHDKSADSLYCNTGRHFSFLPIAERIAL